MTINALNTQAPSLKMVDFAGKSIDLRHYAGQKNVVLVMLRGLW